MVALQEKYTFLNHGKVRLHLITFYLNKSTKSTNLNIFLAAVMAEWLRRLTRNQMGFPRAGSNPAHSEGVLNPNPQPK